MFPSNVEKIFFFNVLIHFLFFVIAAMDGPFPEIDAPNAPFSIKSTIIFESEFKIDAVANPLIIIASQ